MAGTATAIIGAAIPAPISAIFASRRRVLMPRALLVLMMPSSSESSRGPDSPIVEFGGYSPTPPIVGARGCHHQQVSGRITPYFRTDRESAKGTPGIRNQPSL